MERAYDAQRPLDTGERAALPAAAALDLAGEGLWSLGAIHGAAAGPDAAHRHNLRALLPSLELLVTEMDSGG